VTAADIVAGLGGRMRSKSAGIACCPAHEDRNPSLSVGEGRGGRILVRCFGGCSQAEVIDALRREDLWPDRAKTAPLLTRAEYSSHRHEVATRERERARRDDFVERAWQRTWATALPARGSPIEQWLRHRGIDSAKLDLDRLPLRWAPRCPMGKSVAHAMVALMTEPITSRPCGIHRTFLVPDGTGKAAVDSVRRMLGAAGVIRLSPDDEVTLGLGIAEGIETSLAVMVAGWRPVWAAGSLDAIRRFPVLPGIECLTIFADPKPHEVAGARACAYRWSEAGREVRMPIPRNGDWNDALREAE
jgi:Toprim domain